VRLGIAVVGVAVMLGVATSTAGTKTVRPQTPAVETGLPLVAIHFEFRLDEFATHYTVVNTGDPNGSLDLANANYVWTLAPPRDDSTCNNHGNLTGTAREFVWKHGDVDQPGHDDGCHHPNDLPGTGHQGTVSVQVQDGKWVCNASYLGTQGADGSASGNGAPGDCFAPVAPPPACECSNVEAFLNNFHVFGAGTTRIEFDVKWQIECTAGSGDGCNGRVLVLAPRGADFLSQGGKTLRPAHPRVVKVQCAGPCDQTTQGDETLQYVAFETVLDKKGKRHSVPNPGFTPHGRANKTFTMTIDLYCLDSAGVPGTPTTETLTLKFDRLGQVASKKSDLNGDGAPDKGQLKRF
jgi:hypothetical protein